MTFAIHSADGKGIGAGLPDYPPPFRHPVPGYVQAIRDALWSIEIGMGGQVDWQATFGAKQGSVAIGTAAGAHGTQFGFKRRKKVA